MVQVQDVLAAIDNVGTALREIADIEAATSAAQTKLDAVNREIEQKRVERDAVAKQITDLTEKARKLGGEVQAMESQFAGVYDRRNKAQTELRVAQEQLQQLREHVAKV